MSSSSIPRCATANRRPETRCLRKQSCDWLANSTRSAWTSSKPGSRRHPRATGAACNGAPRRSMAPPSRRWRAVTIGISTRREKRCSRRSASASTCSSRLPTCTSSRSCASIAPPVSSGCAPPSVAPADTPATSSSRRKTPPARTSTSSAASLRSRSRKARRRSTCPTRAGTRCRPSTPRCSAPCASAFPQPNKAIVGRNAFAHEAGIHQHGVLQNGLTYEIIAPETVGAGGSSIVLGKHSGRHALERRYRQLGYEPDASTLEQLYEAFTALADKKRQILDEDLLTLLHDGFHHAPEVYNLTHLHVTCGTKMAAADVRVAGPGLDERSATATGNGPIAAAFAAIAEAVGRTIEVLDLSIQSVTPGRDSLGRVILQVRIDGKSLSGHGASTDIVEAGARALVHALNKADHADGLETAALSNSYFWGV